MRLIAGKYGTMTIHIHTAFLKSDTRTLSASCKHHESSKFPYHQSYRKFHNILYATSTLYTMPYYIITKPMQGIKTCMGTSAKVHTLEPDVNRVLQLVKSYNC